MSFPYSYTKKIQLSNKNLILKDISEKIKSLSEKYKFIDINFQNNIIEITTKNSLVYFEYQIKINVDDDNILNIEIQLINLLKLSLLIIVVVPFISNFSIKNFFIFSIAIFSIFYFLNFIYINSFTNQLAKFITEGIEIDTIVEEEISDEQKEWIENPYKCSACGALIEDYYTHCLDCGLKQDRPAKKSPFNTTKYVDYEIKYNFKEK